MLYIRMAKVGSDSFPHIRQYRSTVRRTNRRSPLCPKPPYMHIILSLLLCFIYDLYIREPFDYTTLFHENVGDIS